ncbi:MAG TPA: AAA family ATPase, partial [Candidatus Angelobacter sp.]|nr:AAA family ATPase [Candidatus Angelobacter sp.]
LTSDQSAGRRGSNGAWHNPFEDEQVRATWDAVHKARPEVISHVNGTEASDVLDIPLAEVVDAFYTTAAKIPTALIPPQLAAMLGHFERGAFAGRAGSKQFLEDVTTLWAECRDKATAEARERQQEAKYREALLSRTSVTALLSREFPPEVEFLGSLVTPTTRTFLVGPTGAGKTMVAMAMAGGIASGLGLLGWRTQRPGRVLWFDGEMPLVVMQQRFRELARSYGYNGEFPGIHFVSWQEADGLLPDAKWAPLNTAEGQEFILKLCDLIKPDVVMFDNVQSLIVGDMKDEVPWNDTMPLVMALTARNIGQVWCDHTGHDRTHQYGSSRKAWPFDIVAMIMPLTAPEGELALTLSFDPPGGKARQRTPSNWREYAPKTIRLRDGEWSWLPAEPGAEQPSKGGRPIKDATELLRRTIFTLASAPEVRPTVVQTGMPAVHAIWLGNLKQTLVAEGWFTEDVDYVAGKLSKGFPSLTKGGRNRLAEALKTLKRQGICGYNIELVWPA